MYAYNNVIIHPIPGSPIFIVYMFSINEITVKMLASQLHLVMFLPILSNFCQQNPKLLGECFMIVDHTVYKLWSMTDVSLKEHTFIQLKIMSPLIFQERCSIRSLFSSVLTSLSSFSLLQSLISLTLPLSFVSLLSFTISSLPFTISLSNLTF